MRILVINLERRPDRRAFMDEQAERLGLRFDYVPAIDASAEDPGRIRALQRRGPLGMIALGDVCCTLSHRRAWEMIAEGDDPYGAILEDDAILADDSAHFLADPSWIPAGQRIVKLERYGNSRHKIVVSRASTPVAGRALMRVYSKYSGAAAYIVSREGARFLVDSSATIDVTSDHFLFNPNNSRVARQLLTLTLEPAIVQQGGPGVYSDVRAERLGQRTYDLAYWWREAVRGFYEVRLVPWFVLLFALGRVKLIKPTFAKSKPA